MPLPAVATRLLLHAVSIISSSVAITVFQFFILTFCLILVILLLCHHTLLLRLSLLSLALLLEGADEALHVLQQW
jgi:hypothetical protein